MKFIFDCEDEICLPAAYRIVDEAKPFIDKIKVIDIGDEQGNTERKHIVKKIIENLMVKYPSDTGQMLKKLWVLEDGETAPNAFKTINELVSNEVAIDFFTLALPSLLKITSGISRALT